VYNVTRNEYPTSDELAALDVVFVSGSHHSATQTETPWIAALHSFLARGWSDLDVAPCKLVGICFGHQITAAALGGTAGKNPSGSMRFGVETLACEPAMAELADAVGSPLPIDAGLRILVTHEDCVTELPPSATLLASSDGAAVEAFACRDVVIGFQGHPEFAKDVEMAAIRARASLTPDEAVFADASASLEPSNSELRAFIRAFAAAE